MNKITITIIILILVVVFGGYLLSREAPKADNSSTFGENQETSQSVDIEQLHPDAQMSSPEGGMQAQHETLVTYTDSGFSPNEITVKIGERVTWVNKSSGGMWVASAFHPAHTAYDGTSLSEHCRDSSSFDECGVGDSYTFVFEKVGTWGYHNHMDASDTGKIVVANQ